MTATHAVSVEGKECTVRVVGEVDMANADEVLGWIRDAVDSADCSVLKVDLLRLSFLDSAGVRMLIEARDFARTKGAIMTVVNPQRIVYEVLQISGVAGQFGLAQKS
jgi:anti-sigma B factor antagonist